MGPVSLGHGRQCEDIGLERPHIVVRHIGEGRIGKYREIVAAVGRDAVSHGADEIVIRPGADTMIFVRRDIGGVKGAERGL